MHKYGSKHYGFGLMYRIPGQQISKPRVGILNSAPSAQKSHRDFSSVHGTEGDVIVTPTNRFRSRLFNMTLLFYSKPEQVDRSKRTRQPYSTNKDLIFNYFRKAFFEARDFVTNRDRRATDVAALIQLYICSRNVTQQT